MILCKLQGGFSDKFVVLVVNACARRAQRSHLLPFGATPVFYRFAQVMIGLF
jgi:hypothetical protein